jgi:glycosyltransferase involved in cell wall biosynthesis
MLTDVTTALAARGARIEVITSRLRYEGGDERLAAEEMLNGVRVIRVATSGFGRGNLLGRAVDYLTFYAAAAWTLLRRTRRGDVIVAKTDPPMLSVLAAPVARIRGARLINWLQDIFPEVAQALGVGRGGLAAFGISLLKSARDVSLRSANVNVVLGERMADRVASRSVPITRIRVIPNWADGRRIRQVQPQHNALRREWGLTDAFVVGYSGNLGRAHDIETFITAIEQLERTESGAAPRHEHHPLGRAVAVADRPAPPIRWLFIGGL